MLGIEDLAAQLTEIPRVRAALRGAPGGRAAWTRIRSVILGAVRVGRAQVGDVAVDVDAVALAHGEFGAAPAVRLQALS